MISSTSLARPVLPFLISGSGVNEGNQRQGFMTSYPPHPVPIPPLDPRFSIVVYLPVFSRSSRCVASLVARCKHSAEAQANILSRKSIVCQDGRRGPAWTRQRPSRHREAAHRTPRLPEYIQ